MKQSNLVAVVCAVMFALPPKAFADDEDPDVGSDDEASETKKPKRGDFDAGGQLRLPNGPDEMGEFATFNWIAVDAKGRYFLLDKVTIDAFVPLAVKKPDTVGGVEPKLIGGMQTTLRAQLEMNVPFQPTKYKSEVGIIVSGAYMREGAMLLSDKDFPLFAGDFQPGFTAGTLTRVRLSSVVDFSLNPVFVFQSGTDDNLTAVQIPTALTLAVGSLVKLSADAGVYTGDDYSFSGDSGGRITLGAALDVKLGKIIVHAGAGFASLLTGGAYPEIGDSVYIDLNVKYAK